MNDHLFLNMRIKDENKIEAIHTATIKLVNEIGFVASSVAKIAKEAGVSPATLYIYYENKEDLLVSTYIDIKKKMGQALLVGFDSDFPLKDILKRIWLNGFKFVENHRNYFEFAEQFANSPYAGLVDHNKLEEYFKPIASVFMKGIDERKIKNVPTHLLTIFAFYPIMLLSNSRICHGAEINDEVKNLAFEMAWDSIKK